MVGDKIRQRRLELHLSQAQLAGKEMSREFISLVESGKCSPSPKKLSIIARRLNKSVAYFLEEAPDDPQLETILVLVNSAERDLVEGHLAGLSTVIEQLESALGMIDAGKNPDLTAQIHYLLALAYNRASKYEEAVEQCQAALEHMQQLDNRDQLVTIYTQLGKAHYRLEDFKMACKAYEKAVLYSSELKTQQQPRTEALTMLGSCNFRLGNFPEAIARYQEALDECQPGEDPARWGKTAMGLGMAFLSAGQLPEAKSWTDRAAGVLRQCQRSEWVLALHNVAVVAAASGNWEQAYVTLQECIQIYRAEGRLVKQASALEDLAHYWMHKGDLSKAEENCWEAVKLLDLEDNGILRGRLFRLLGAVALRKGQLQQAQYMLRISLEEFRRLKAAAEATDTAEELGRLTAILSMGVYSAG